MNHNTSKQQVIVSMTSFPAAIPYAQKAVESILNGSVLPDKVILYLTFSQFGEKGIPQQLLNLSQVNPKFEIRNYDKDIRSYRKLIPALADFPDAIIVTVDDDVAYNKICYVTYCNFTCNILKLYSLIEQNLCIRENHIVNGRSTDGIISYSRNTLRFQEYTNRSRWSIISPTFIKGRNA